MSTYFDKLPREIQAEITEWLTTYRDLYNANSAGFAVSGEHLSRVTWIEHRERYRPCIQIIQTRLTHKISEFNHQWGIYRSSSLLIHIGTSNNPTLFSYDECAPFDKLNFIQIMRGMDDQCNDSSNGIIKWNFNNDSPVAAEKVVYWPYFYGHRTDNTRVTE